MNLFFRFVAGPHWEITAPLDPSWLICSPTKLPGYVHASGSNMETPIYANLSLDKSEALDSLEQSNGKVRHVTIKRDSESMGTSRQKWTVGIEIRKFHIIQSNLTEQNNFVSMRPKIITFLTQSFGQERMLYIMSTVISKFRSR